MRNCHSPERGILCYFIGDPTLKIALLFLTISSASKPHFDKSPVIVNPIICKTLIHKGILVTLQSKPRGVLIDIYFSIILVILNNKSYIFCYCKLEYDKYIIFDLFILFIIYHHFLTNFESVIYCHLYYSFLKRSKNYINFIVQF